MRVRPWSEIRAAGDDQWFARPLERLHEVRASADSRLAGLIDPRLPAYLARAPGRLDVMGGIADYSGGRVLELPLARATWALVQHQAAPRCDVATYREGRWDHFSTDLRPLILGDRREPGALAAWFAEPGQDPWAAYVIGVVQLCLRQAIPAGALAIPGFRVLIDSTVPEGKGIASSAALEISVMAALSASLGSDLVPAQQAVACQWVENHVVGAPCGIMDQMTCACGRKDRLLQVLCQPGTIEGQLVIPEGYRFYGIDSGVRRALSGSGYGTVRTAAFMGYRMIAEAAGLTVTGSGGRIVVDDPRWNGYLANLSVGEFERDFAARLPEQLSGAEFLARFGGITDEATVVRPERRYPVRRATTHPVYEQARVTRFAALLPRLSEEPSAAVELGRLMHQSHRSYGDCGLGSEDTDALVAAVMQAGWAEGLFGAKITGGGSGGTVAVFGTREAAPRVRAIAEAHAGCTGRPALVFDESGPGAAELGVVVLEGGAAG